MALTERQRDLLLQGVDRKLDRLLHLLEPPKDEGERTRKKDPRALYGSKPQ